MSADVSTWGLAVSTRHAALASCRSCLAELWAQGPQWKFGPVRQSGRFQAAENYLVWNQHIIRIYDISPPARRGLLDFMSVACSSPPLLSSSSCSTATLDAQCSLSDLNHDHPRPVFPAGPQPRPSPPSVPCRTSTTTIHAQCSLPDLNREYPRQVFPAGPHVGRYGTKNVQKKVRKNVRQVCYILLANSRVCGRVTGAMPLLTLQVAKSEAISLNRWQSHWGGQRHFHFCTFGAVCKDAWDRQHLTASYYKLHGPLTCLYPVWQTDMHNDLPGETNDWDS